MQVFSADIPGAVPRILSRIPSLYTVDAVVVCTAVWALIKLTRVSRKRAQTPRLTGPPSSSYLYGAKTTIMQAEDPPAVYEAWTHEYGDVYEVPSTLGSRRIIVQDMKAMAHFYSKQGLVYVRIPALKKMFERMIGRGILWAEGDNHRGQRKSLTPAFSIAAIRKLTPVFFDSAHKAKTAWNVVIESNGGESAIIEVQNWMNHISLDSIGLAGFSHDFGAVDGKESSISKTLEAYSSPSSIAIGIDILLEMFPFLAWVPTPRRALFSGLNTAMLEISNALLARTGRELTMGVVGGREEKSIIGLLVKGASGRSEFQLSNEEVLAQMKTLLLAGYETTALNMTWGLVELCRHPEIQIKLRNELIEHGRDPTYDELSNGLPYLDAVVHELLRIHPVTNEMTRQAAEDDVLPLSKPIRMKSGELIDKLSIAKGTIVEVPAATINRSATFWGEDAKEFKPSRWLDGSSGLPAKAQEIQAYRHILTFGEGPRVCMGRNFAVTEFKVVMAVLVRNFVFEFRDGPKTKVEYGPGFLPRAKVVGEPGCDVPLRVKPYIE